MSDITLDWSSLLSRVAQTQCLSTLDDQPCLVRCPEIVAEHMLAQHATTANSS